ncbi:MAG: phosphate-starvation-inducible PsiE family protein [Synechococcaceae cyanobacterium]|nr:phosphate-starvation-inducible PsiE family protein [Synechococcaceae cyanobacterium]
MLVRQSLLRRLISDASFLRGVDRTERLLAKVLALVLLAVTAAAVVEVSVETLKQAFDGSSRLVGVRLTTTLGHLLDILIALEVLQNITSYLRRGVVQIELVLATAITAVARKVIVLPPGAENKPMLLLSLGVAVLFLATAWWLVHQSLNRAHPTTREPARWSPEPDPSPAADGDDAERSAAHPPG